MVTSTCSRPRVRRHDRVVREPRRERRELELPRDLYRGGRRVSVFGIDLDGDGDVDVLSASQYDDTIAWYENLDGSGGSWSYHEISTAADGARSVFGIDLDGDGDVDVLSAS